MANEKEKCICLKALVDKGNNRILYAESDEDFVDVLFNFLTMPVGTVIKLISNQPSTVEIGCINNLYTSVQNLNEQFLQTPACKTMLLHPRNEAEPRCLNLKMKIHCDEPTQLWVCGGFNCTWLSQYGNARCRCRKYMSRHYSVKESIKQIDLPDGGVFVRGPSRFIVSDELEVMPLSTVVSFSLLTKLGVLDGSNTEERTFNVGADEVLSLLKCSVLSKTPLTEALLKHEPVPLLGKENSIEGFVQTRMEGSASNEDRKISVKLMMSISKKRLCYAEAGKDFVDLLFSYLTIPLGYIGKVMHGSSSKKCLAHLYKSASDLDADQYFKSIEHKAMLVNPKLAFGFGYKNQLLDIGEASIEPFYFYVCDDGSYKLTNDKNLARSATAYTVMDPKSHYGEESNGGGYVKGPTMYTITDNLVITPVSSISGITILNKLNVPFTDISERVVHVGKQEALRLLVASFSSQSALTNAFVATESKQV